MNSLQPHLFSSNKKSDLLFITSAAISLAGLAWFAWFNRISIDDMFFFARGRDEGIIAAVTEQYHKYSGRFSAYFLNVFVLKYFSHWMLALWNVISILCFFAALRYCWNVVGFLPRVEKTGWIFLSCTLLYGAVHPGEEFFWYTQVNTYLWAATCLLTITGICLRKPAAFHIILLIICCVFAGGASESMVLPFIILFTAYTVYTWQTATRQVKITRLTALVVLSITLYMNVSAPGNALRIQTLAEQHHIGFIKAFITALYHYFIGFNALYSYIWLIPLLVITALLVTKPVFSFTIWQLSTGYAVLLALFMAPGVWVLREPLPARALIACDVLSLAYSIAVIQILLQRLPKKPFMVLVTGNVVLPFIIAIQGISAFRYARAYDIRDAQLKQSYSYEWFIKPLPGCSMYKNASVTPNNRLVVFKHTLLYYKPALH